MRKRGFGGLLVLLAAIVAALATSSSALAWTVEMTAVPKLKRTYAWKIEKSVSQPALTLKTGETADVTYSVTATPTGSVDSDWSVSGRVTMSSDPVININTVEVFVLPEDFVASVACVPVPPSTIESGMTCDYSSPLPDAAAGRIAQLRAQQVNGNRRGIRLPFDFADAVVNQVDETVTVTDSMTGALGTLNAADGAKTFTYTKTIGPFTAAECGQKTVDNTAVYTAGDSGATASASAAVSVTITCPPPPPPPAPKCALPSLVWGFVALAGPTQFKTLLPVSLGTAGGAKSVNVTSVNQALMVFAQELLTTNGVSLLQTELLAAKLNAATGRDVSAIAATMAAAEAFLATNASSSWYSLSSSTKNQVNGWMNALETYNNQCIPDHGGGGGATTRARSTGTSPATTGASGSGTSGTGRTNEPGHSVAPADAPLSSGASAVRGAGRSTRAAFRARPRRSTPRRRGRR